MSRIWATRPVQQNLKWSIKLRQFGRPVVDAPLIAITALDRQGKAQAITHIQNLGDYQKIIFVSQNAVSYALDEIDTLWPQLPVRQSWFAVGERTRKLLLEKLAHYYGDQRAVFTGETSMNSEALLALPELTNVGHEKILIFRGVGGRPKLDEVLTRRGALVDYCELYERKKNIETQRLIHEEGNKLRGDIVPVFSVESLENFHSALNVSDRQSGFGVKLIVPGQRVAEYAKKIGYQNITIAMNATEDEMLASLVNVIKTETVS